jgi:hypothetical protein
VACYAGTLRLNSKIYLGLAKIAKQGKGMVSFRGALSGMEKIVSRLEEAKG